MPSVSTVSTSVGFWVVLWIICTMLTPFFGSLSKISVGIISTDRQFYLFCLHCTESSLKVHLHGFWTFSRLTVFSTLIWRLKVSDEYWKIIVWSWLDTLGITEMKLAFCMLDWSSESVKVVNMFKTVISALVWTEVNFGLSTHWMSVEVQPIDCVALCGIRLFL
jgi:hypothetical protein